MEEISPSATERANFKAMHQRRFFGVLLGWEVFIWVGTAFILLLVALLGAG